MKTRIRHMAEDIAAVALAASWIFAMIVLFVACPAGAWQLCAYTATHE